jgi:hypothetical protein
VSAPPDRRPALIAPAGGWQAAMTATGTTYHVLDPVDDHPRPLTERRALCGISPVFPVRPTGGGDVCEATPLCRRCKATLLLYTEAAAPTLGPDPLLHLLRAGGLRGDDVSIAAGIARGYLAAELNNAIARGEVVLNERAQRRALAGRDTSPLRFGALMLAWARDAVHNRRVWPPPDVVGEPPGEPQ